MATCAGRSIGYPCRSWRDAFALRIRIQAVAVGTLALGATRQEAGRPSSCDKKAYRRELAACNGDEASSPWLSWVRDCAEEVTNAAAAALLAEEENEKTSPPKGMANRTKRGKCKTKRAKASQPALSVSCDDLLKPLSNVQVTQGIQAEPVAVQAASSAKGSMEESRVGAAMVTQDTGAENATECVLCWIGRRDHLFARCNHVCVCEACAKLIMMSSHRCPICRAETVDFMKVFLV